MANLSNTSLALTSILVFLVVALSYSQRLGLEKDILLSASRAFIQLLIIGYILKEVFQSESLFFTLLLLLFMLTNAAYHGSKRGKGIDHSFGISFFSMFLATSLTLGVLLGTGALDFVPNQVIPVGGMLLSNSMVALGLVYRSLYQAFENQREEVESKLSLGASPREAFLVFIQEAVKTGMLPSIDSAKTLGLVSLPGMMTGLILAGMNPVVAIKYQVMVTFMLLATTSISSIIAANIAYKTFFNDSWQLVKKES